MASPVITQDNEVWRWVVTDEFRNTRKRVDVFWSLTS